MLRYTLFLATVLVAAFAIAGPVAAQERVKWVAPQSGTWEVIGVDEENVVWTGSSLRLARQTTSGNNVTVRGYFDWRSSDGEFMGREYVRGTFDRTNGRMLLRGYRIRNERGELALGRYVGFLGGKGRRIMRGRWGGNDVVKGEWSAVFSPR